MDDRGDQHRKNSKTRDRALIVLLIGIALLMPPLAGIFQLDLKLFGLPVTLIYLFAVWAALIVATAILSRALGRADDPSERS